MYDHRFFRLGLPLALPLQLGNHILQPPSKSGLLPDGVPPGDHAERAVPAVKSGTVRIAPEVLRIII